MIELTSIFFTCDPLPTCRVSMNFCPGGIKVALSPLGGCVFPECPPPDRNTCIGCVFLGGTWSDHQCNLGCVQPVEKANIGDDFREIQATESDGGTRDAACYDTIEDC